MVAVALAENTYTTKYDNIDLDTILTSDRLLKNYVNCLLGKGNCTPDGKELKGKCFESLLFSTLRYLARFDLNVNTVTSIRCNSRNAMQ